MQSNRPTDYINYLTIICWIYSEFAKKLIYSFPHINANMSRDLLRVFFAFLLNASPVLLVRGRLSQKSSARPLNFFPQQLLNMEYTGIDCIPNKDIVDVGKCEISKFRSRSAISLLYTFKKQLKVYHVNYLSINLAFLKILFSWLNCRAEFECIKKLKRDTISWRQIWNSICAIRRLFTRKSRNKFISFLQKNLKSWAETFVLFRYSKIRCRAPSINYVMLEIERVLQILLRCMVLL